MKSLKSILILTASGRNGSNSSIMAEVFAATAESRGHEVKIVNVIDYNIKPCTGCGYCYEKGKPCIEDDDFNKLAPLIIAADVIVFACPVYWYNFPAQTKLVIDKFISFTYGRIPLRGKKAALLTCAEDNNKKRVFEAISLSYDKMVSFMNWSSIGKVMQEGVNEAGDIKNTRAIKDVENLVTAYL